MLLSTVGALALAITGTLAAEEISPLFFFSSTKSLSVPSISDSPPVSDIHHALWGGLSSCPTKHYAVVIQPGVSASDYEDTWLPIGAGTRTALIASDIRGKVDITAVVNTILMDCLHHGVTRVEELNTSELKLADLDADVLGQSIIYANMPDVGELNGRERRRVLDRHDGYVQAIVGGYFGSKDYTMIYIAQEGKNVKDGSADLDEEGHGLGAEVPFVFGEE